MIAGYTSKGFKLIDFNSDNWHQDEWDNWNLLNGLLQASYGDLALPVVGGTPNAITLDYTPNEVLANGLRIVFVLTASPTAATTVAVDGAAAKNLLLLGGAVTAGMLQAGDVVEAVYDGTQFHVIYPIRSFSSLLVNTGPTGATPSANADNIVVHDVSSAGISLLNPAGTGFGYLAFGDAVDPLAGYIRYNHGSNEMDFRAGGTTIMTASSSQVRFLSSLFAMNLSGVSDFWIEEFVPGSVRLGSSGVNTGIRIDMTSGNVELTDDLEVGGNLVVTGNISGTIVGSDVAFGASWNGNVGVASKNAIYDEMILKATIDSPALTGNPTAPTPATADNDTSIATTAFVKAQGYATLASPTFTGTVQYTAAVGASTSTVEVGFRGVPHQNKTAAYTVLLGDRDTCINITTGGVNIPDNSVTAFPIGTTILIYNDSAVSQNIAMLGTDTLRLTGTATTGTRALAQRGQARIHKVKLTEWICDGAGVT